MSEDTGGKPGAEARRKLARRLSAIVKVITDGAFVGLPVMIVLQVGSTPLAVGVYALFLLLLLLLATLGLRLRGSLDPVAIATSPAGDNGSVRVGNVALRAIFTLIGAWALVFGFFGLVRLFGERADLQGLSGVMLLASLGFSLLASIAVAIEPRGPQPPPSADR